MYGNNFVFVSVYYLSILTWRIRKRKLRTSTQVKDVGQKTAGSVVFRRFHGSSIPVNGSGHQIYPVSLGTDRNLSKPTAGYGSPDSCVECLTLPGEFRSETGNFLRVLARNPRTTASGIIDRSIYKCDDFWIDFKRRLIK